MHSYIEQFVSDKQTLFSFFPLIGGGGVLGRPRGWLLNVVNRVRARRLCRLPHAIHLIGAVRDDKRSRVSKNKEMTMVEQRLPRTLRYQRELCSFELPIDSRQRKCQLRCTA
jgi:hypothetical protein